MGEAWERGLRGDHASAIELIDEVLKDCPSTILGLRIKGNLLDLKAVDELAGPIATLVTSRDFLCARACYEQILRLDPQNAPARIDLGDQFKTLRAFDRCLGYYEQAVDVLATDEDVESRTKYLGEILDRISELEVQCSSAKLSEIRKSCNAILNGGQPGPSGPP